MFLADHCCVEDTAQTAANSKWSASVKGYYDDPFIEHFLELRHIQLPHQNLGSYIRTTTIIAAIKKFYDKFGSGGQVVVLGCGYDTLFWLMRNQGMSFSVWLELDKTEVINTKKSKINLDIFLPLDNYFLEECDLGDTTQFLSFYEMRINPSAPILFIDEFTLIYCETEISDWYISFAAKSPQNMFVSYGMTNLDDDFGQLVCSSFNEMGIALKSGASTSTPSTAEKRFIDKGFLASASIRSDQALGQFFDQKEIHRITKLELFDSPKELKYILKHYITCVAGDEDFIKCLFPPKKSA